MNSNESKVNAEVWGSQYTSLPAQLRAKLDVDLRDTLDNVPEAGHTLEQVARYIKRCVGGAALDGYARSLGPVTR